MIWTSGFYILAGMILLAATFVSGILLMVRKDLKVVHVLVNSNLSRALTEIEDLKNVVSAQADHITEDRINRMGVEEELHDAQTH